MADDSLNIYRQYSGAERIYTLIETFNQAVSMDDFTEEFIKEVWDVSTSTSYGLDCWGKIVGVGRYLTLNLDNDEFGYSDGFFPFNQAPFYSPVKETNNFLLADDAYRTLILCKAFSNISIATIPEINKFLTMLFYGRGRAYVSGNHRDMQMSITVTFELTGVEEAILQNYDVMPIPSGVRCGVSYLPGQYLGFANGFYPFGEGTLYSEKY